ncbi:MAG: L-ribulose-5-phosphate 4-epimerase AraD [Candidatus Nanoarchaeia archaeon]
MIVNVCNANKELKNLGLVIFTWGNVSAIDRARGEVAIKPSGVPYDKLQPEDIVVVDLDGRIISGSKKPSSDTLAHLELYRRFKGVGSIVHTHSVYASAFAQARMPIACMGTTHADYFSGPVPVTRLMTKEEVTKDYELNTGKLIVEHFLENKLDPMIMPACLVAGHAPFIWGNSPAEAVHNAKVLETVAQMNLLTLQLNSNITDLPSFLLEKHYMRKHGPTAYYGQKRAKND